MLSFCLSPMHSGSAILMVSATVADLLYGWFDQDHALFDLLRLQYVFILSFVLFLYSFSCLYCTFSFSRLCYIYSLHLNMYVRILFMLYVQMQCILCFNLHVNTFVLICKTCIDYVYMHVVLICCLLTLFIFIFVLFICYLSCSSLFIIYL